MEFCPERPIMTIIPEHARRTRGLSVALALFIGAVTGSGPGSGSAWGTEPAAAPIKLPELVLLKPGTQLDGKLPTGWSVLVIKSVPRLASGDLESLPGMASSTATLFHTAVLADIRAEGSGADRRYALRRIGLGLCVPVEGKDTVVMSDTAAKQGIDLGIVGRTVLDRAQQELQRGRLVARTPTFALFSAPAVMKLGTVHREVLLRYALLVDPDTGDLRTLVWAIESEPSRRAAPRTMVLMTPALVFDCGLDVTAERLFGTLPVNWSFALRNLPGGLPRAVPAPLQPWSVRDARTLAEASQFETTLRQALNASVADRSH